MAPYQPPAQQISNAWLRQDATWQDGSMDIPSVLHGDYFVFANLDADTVILYSITKGKFYTITTGTKCKAIALTDEFLVLATQHRLAYLPLHTLPDHGTRIITVPLSQVGTFNNDNNTVVAGLKNRIAIMSRDLNKVYELRSQDSAATQDQYTPVKVLEFHCRDQDWLSPQWLEDYGYSKDDFKTAKGMMMEDKHIVVFTAAEDQHDGDLALFAIRYDEAGKIVGMAHDLQADNRRQSTPSNSPTIVVQATGKAGMFHLAVPWCGGFSNWFVNISGLGSDEWLRTARGAEPTHVMWNDIQYCQSKDNSILVAEAHFPDLTDWDTAGAQIKIGQILSHDPRLSNVKLYVNDKYLVCYVRYPLAHCHVLAFDKTVLPGALPFNKQASLGEMHYWKLHSADDETPPPDPRIMVWLRSRREARDNHD